jgi:SAM-dependent MidA family methyltransferase
MHSENSSNILPEPPEELKSISAELVNTIQTEITESGAMPFSRYMEIVLYEPGLGYYSAGLKKFGKGGDFVTAPLLGNVFARCLAKQVEQIGNNLATDNGGGYEIIEAGAGTGMLAADLLKALQEDCPPLRYQILERSAHLRQVQKETLMQLVPEWMDRISWLDELPEQDWQGVFLANEVLDALTVERFGVEEDGISQMLVRFGPDGFEWFRGPCPPSMEEKILDIFSRLETRPAAGYRSELNTGLPAWLSAVTDRLTKGAALFVDYGYTQREYYRPKRSDGTLICHYQHRAHADPFSWPGLTDISTSVNFTALAEAADDCGLEVSGYTTQAMFLLSCGLSSLLHEFESLPEKERLMMNNQVRRLTLPAEMGERFQVMALSRGLDESSAENLLGFQLADLRHRL